ncbi:site-specific integrase [Hymenobacter sp. GOD-10R]|uniref:site-specific integrase n=1 Tax=Hymenobacter sp. GOD-10R TaxID=3093922 RepID=UPI002D79B879|nr:site-specific integrase [Hymenobacter sp. GOD-10R]WRQ27071.1 site-specific integrase [Hymenobacter sp. GOD-10R]
MATVSFHLKEPQADRPTAIYALLTIDRGNRLKIYTGQSIHPSKWIKDDQRAKERGKGNELNGHLNDALNGIQDRLLTTYAEHLAAGALPTAAQLKAAAAPVAITPKVPQLDKADLLTVFTEWIASRSLTHTPNTLRTYRTTLRHLRDFQSAAKYPVAFDTVGGTFSQRLAEYLLTKRQLRDTAVRKNLVILKCFLAWATEHGYPVPPDYKKISWQRREPDILTLTRAEVVALASLDLRPALNNARGLFLLGVYTGLRFSDVAALRPEHIHVDRLRLTTQKTRDTLTIPIRPEARPLLAQIVAGTLRPLPNQVLNRYLKELAALAGIDTLTERTHYAGGKRHTTTAPKYEFVTTHTARRTFVTLALEAGLRPELIMKITGHKDLKSFSRYVNVTEDSVLTEFARVYETPVVETTAM